MESLIQTLASNSGLITLAAAITMGLTAIGGTVAQGKVASSALEGIARNPEASGKVFTPLILGLVLIESLVLFGFVIAFMIQGHQGTLIKAGLKAAGIELE